MTGLVSRLMLLCRDDVLPVRKGLHGCFVFEDLFVVVEVALLLFVVVVVVVVALLLFVVVVVLVPALLFVVVVHFLLLIFGSALLQRTRWLPSDRSFVTLVFLESENDANLVVSSPRENVRSVITLTQQIGSRLKKLKILRTKK